MGGAVNDSLKALDTKAMEQYGKLFCELPNCRQDAIRKSILREEGRASSEKPYYVKSRTVHGLNSIYREYIVVRLGGSTTYGPFHKKSEAHKQADYLNETVNRQ